MNIRQAKKIYGKRRGRPDSPGIAHRSMKDGHYGPNCDGPWPWNWKTWSEACRWYWLKNIRNEVRKHGRKGVGGRSFSFQSRRDRRQPRSKDALLDTAGPR